MPTTDIVILNGLFNNLSDAANILGIDADYIKKVKKIQQKLPPVQINKNGAIQEWISDFKESEPGHRHYSHLIGLYPLNQITEKTPELYKAAAKTVEIRTKNCDYRSGWHTAWTINLYARLKKANEANEDVKLLIKSLWQNMFDQTVNVLEGCTPIFTVRTLPIF